MPIDTARDTVLLYETRRHCNAAQRLGRIAGVRLSLYPLQWKHNFTK